VCRPDARANLVLATPLGCGDLQFAGGFPRCDIGRRIKNREVPADDFLGTIAFKTLSPGVPRRDVTVHIEHENRVVHDAVDEQIEQMLGDGRFGEVCRHHSPAWD
jgi:hypothetical protein